MAKKPSQLKSEPKLKSIIRNYINKLGRLDKDFTNQDLNLEFGFGFLFPKGKTPNGKELGRTFQVVKRKKLDYIEVAHSTTISPEHVKIIESKNKWKDLFNELVAFFLAKEVEFTVEGPQKRYSIARKRYLDKNKHISLNTFYKILQKIFSIDVYGIYLVQKYCNEKIDPNSLKSGPGPSMFV